MNAKSSMVITLDGIEIFVIDDFQKAPFLIDNFFELFEYSNRFEGFAIIKSFFSSIISIFDGILIFSIDEFANEDDPIEFKF